MADRYVFFVNVAYSFSILRPLQEAIRKMGGEPAWFLHGLDASHLKADEILLSSVEEVRAFGPKAVFAPGNWVPDFFPGIKVEVFHGFHAYKRPENRGHFRIRGFFDLYCTHGPSTTLPFQELAARCGTFEVCETGWPKLDPLFDGPGPAKRNERPVIFLTSTFTPALSCADPLFETVRALSKNEKWQWLVNFHPLMDGKVVAKYRSIRSGNLRYVSTDDIIPLLRRADVMVSDTSSVVTEFLVTKKPVVTYRNRKPGSHLVNIVRPEDLADAVSFALSRPRKLLNAIDVFVEKEHPYRDGRSSHRVLQAAERLAEKGLSHLKSKPLNLIRRLKVRKNMKYYRF